jgi:hypothetical protein
MNVFTKGVVGHSMQMETKFLRLRTPVELGSWFGGWQILLAGWMSEIPAVLSGDAGEGAVRNSDGQSQN